MLELLCHKRNPLITTVDGAIFTKKDCNLREKHFCSVSTMLKL